MMIVDGLGYFVCLGRTFLDLKMPAKSYDRRCGNHLSVLWNGVSLDHAGLYGSNLLKSSSASQLMESPFSYICLGL